MRQPAVIFGQADNAGWLAAAMMLLPLVGGGVVWMLTYLTKRRKSSIDEWREIVARQDAHIAAQQVEQNKCHEDRIRSNRVIVYLHGYGSRNAELLRQQGITVEPVMTLAELLGDPAAAEFEHRNIAQGTALVREEAKRAVDGHGKVKPADGETPGGPS